MGNNGSGSGNSQGNPCHYSHPREEYITTDISGPELAKRWKDRGWTYRRITRWSAKEQWPRLRREYKERVALELRQKLIKREAVDQAERVKTHLNIARTLQGVAMKRLAELRTQVGKRTLSEREAAAVAVEAVKLEKIILEECIGKLMITGPNGAPVQVQGGLRLDFSDPENIRLASELLRRCGVYDGDAAGNGEPGRSGDVGEQGKVEAL